MKSAMVNIISFAKSFYSKICSWSKLRLLIYKNKKTRKKGLRRGCLGTCKMLKSNFGLDPSPGRCPWTPLGALRPPDPRLKLGPMEFLLDGPKAHPTKIPDKSLEYLYSCVQINLRVNLNCVHMGFITRSIFVCKFIISGLKNVYLSCRYMRNKKGLLHGVLVDFGNRGESCNGQA